MNSKFDELIKKNLKNNFDNELADNFTESVISKILEVSRNRKVEPLVNRKFWNFLLLVVLFILGLSFLTNGTSDYQSNTYYIEYLNMFRQFISKSINFPLEYSIIIFIILSFVLFDLLLKRIFHSRKLF